MQLAIKNCFFCCLRHMINRVQIGHQAVARVVTKPAKIEIGNASHKMNKAKIKPSPQTKRTKETLFIGLDEYLPKIVIPKKELNWEEDMQLKSKYMDRKVRKSFTLTLMSK